MGVPGGQPDVCWRATVGSKRTESRCEPGENGEESAVFSCLTPRVLPGARTAKVGAGEFLAILPAGYLEPIRHLGLRYNSHPEQIAGLCRSVYATLW
jgi:hypothetical protein